MAKSRSRPKKDGKRIHIELTYLSSFLWGVFLFFLLAWVFVLGIFVGRGFLPGNVTVLSDMKAKMRKVYEIVGHDRPGDPGPAKKGPDPDPKLAFYEKLSNKKDEVRRKLHPESKNEDDSKDATQGPKKSRDLDTARFTVQLVSFSDGAMAQKRVEELTDRGYPAYFYEAKVKGKTYYRVRCGRFTSREEAGIYAEKLEKEGGIKGFVSRIE